MKALVSIPTRDFPVLGVLSCNAKVLNFDSLLPIQLRHAFENAATVFSPENLLQRDYQDLGEEC